jgi:hypothetical protein
LGKKKGFAEAPAQMSLGNEKDETLFDNYRFFEFHLSMQEPFQPLCSSTVLLPKKRREGNWVYFRFFNIQ